MASKLTSDYFGTISTGLFQNDYAFLEIIGKGGYGEVYKVISKKDYHTYAVKKVRFDQHRHRENLHFIKRELINNAKLSHENIVRYYDSWVELSADQNSSRSCLSEDTGTFSSKGTNLTENVPETFFADRCDYSNEPGNIQRKSVANGILTQENKHKSCSELNENDFTSYESYSDFDCKNALLSTRLSDSAANTFCSPDFQQSRDALSECKNSMPTETEKHDKSDSDFDVDILFEEDEPFNAEMGVVFNDITHDAFLAFEYVGNMLKTHQSAFTAEDVIREIKKYVLGTENSLEHLKPESLCFIAPKDTESSRVLELYIKMEFCDRTLREAIDSGTFTDNDDQCWNYFRQIVRGLDYIHSKGIIHRDLNPNNIFITSENLVKIGDFGLSRLQSGSEINKSVDEKIDVRKMEELTGGRGTVWYSAPEMLYASSCNYDQEVDLFSLGLIFFEMCYIPIHTRQEKARIFEKLRKRRTFPDSFDQKAKQKQAEIIKTLLSHNPKNRTPLRDILSLIDGCDSAKDAKEVQAEAILANIVDNPGGELYRKLIEKLFSQNTGRRLSIYRRRNTSEQTMNTKLAFVNIAKSHGARGICLPLLLPLEDTEMHQNPDLTAFLDAKGNPVCMSDGSLRAFIHELGRKETLQNCSFYNTETINFVQDDSGEKLSGRKSEICYFALSVNDDMLPIGKALLILQKTLIKTGHCTDDFVICITHKELENGLMAIYNLGETERGVLYRLFELVGDTSSRIRILKQINETGLAIPEILIVSGGFKRMVGKLRGVLGHLHRACIGSDPQVFERLYQVLDFLTELIEVCDAIGVSIDTKLELFIKNPQRGARDSGVKFRLRAKPELNVVARGGQLEIDVQMDGMMKKREFMWLELYSAQLKEDKETPATPDVTIVYDKTKYDEVKSTAYLCGKLTNLGLTVTEVEQSRENTNEICVPSYCKFIVNFVPSDTSILDEKDTKLQKIPVTIQTVVNHIKQRRNILCRRYMLNYRIHYNRSSINRILIYRMRLNHSRVGAVKI